MGVVLRIVSGLLLLSLAACSTTEWEQSETASFRWSVGKPRDGVDRIRFSTLRNDEQGFGIESSDLRQHLEELGGDIVEIEFRVRLHRRQELCRDIVRIGDLTEWDQQWAFQFHPGGTVETSGSCRTYDAAKEVMDALNRQ